jgi:hypothetical protein
MSLTAPTIDNRHVSRKLTVNINQHSVNVRPVIKGNTGSFMKTSMKLIEYHL